MRRAAARVPASILLLASLALPGCGGGGGGGGEAPATPSEPPAPSGPLPAASDFANHPSFGGQWGLAAIRADHAYENLAADQGAEVRPGGGASVGFIDTGIDRLHPAFAGKRVDEHLIVGDGDASGLGRASHGTAVASVAAASRRDDGSFHGVAWAADVELFAIFLDRPPPPGTSYQQVLLATLESRDEPQRDPALYDSVLDEGRSFDVLNLSFGFQGLIQGYSEADLREHYSNTIASLAQAGAEEKKVLVWAAGNAHRRTCGSGPGCVGGSLDAASPEVLAGLMARIPELRGHSVAVVATGRNGTITDFSNRCGIAAEWCIAAPGRDMTVAYWGPDRDGNPFRGVRHGAGGTSYAAPMVAGAFAVMRSFFDGQMSNEELVARMYATANKSGRYANEAVYGQGLLDLGAATEPVGSTSVAAGATVWEGGAPFAATSLRLGSAFGDGVRRSLGGRRLMVFDELGAPFRRPLAGRVADGEDGTGDLGASLRALLAAPLSAWGEADAGAPRAPSPSSLQHLAHVRGRGGELPALRWGGDGGGFTGAFFSTGRGEGGAASAVADGGSASGMVFSWRPSSGPLSALRLRAGGLYEEEGLFGTSADGAFGRISNRSLFAGVERRWEEAGGGWRLSASAELGMSSPDWEGTLVAGASPVVTSGFSLRAARAASWGGDRRRRGWLEWSLTQPLRVERADVALSVPVRRTAGTGVVVRERWQLNAAPSGRQLDLGLRWEHPLAEHSALRLGAVRTYDPGHDADAAPRWSLLAGLRYAF